MPDSFDTVIIGGGFYGLLLTPTENGASFATWVLVIVATLTIYGSCNTNDHDTN